MAYTTSNGRATIACDKCGATESAQEQLAGEAFFNSGWGLSLRARKYKHRCRGCQTKKEQKAHDFVKANLLP